MSIGFVGESHAVGNGTSWAVTIPAGVSVGDALLLHVGINATDTITVPAGWTSLDSVVNSMKSQVWTRVAQAGDAGSTVTVTHAASTHASVQLFAYTGTSATPIAAHAVAIQAFGTTSYATPASTVPAGGGVVVSIWGNKSSDTTTWTAPVGQTARSHADDSGGGHINLLAADGGTIGAGACGGVTATCDGTPSRNIGWTIVLAPGSTDATTTAVVATASATAPAPTVNGTATVAPPAATASAAAPAPAVTTTSNAPVTAVVATATGQAVAPSVTGAATVTAVVATATAAAVAPAVSGSGVVSAVVATATAGAVAPSVTGDATVDAVVVTASASAPAPSVSTASGTVVNAPVSTATATALAPSVAYDFTVLATSATATAAAAAPAVSADGNTTINAVPAMATAQAIAPVVGIAEDAAAAAVSATATAEALAPVVFADATVEAVAARGFSAAQRPVINHQVPDRIPLRARLNIDRAIINLASDPSQYVSSGTAGAVGGGSSRTDTYTQEGSFRSYAGGNTRLVLGSATSRVLSPLVMRACTPDAVAKLLAWTGKLVLFRDSYGRKLYGSYLAPAITDIPLSGTAGSTLLSDVSIVLTESVDE